MLQGSSIINTEIYQAAAFTRGKRAIGGIMITINDLFRISFLWNKYYYLELLHPLSEEDFMITSPVAQSVRFLTEDNWYYEKESKRHLDGREYNIVYHAIIAIKLNYEEEVKECLKENIHSDKLVGLPKTIVKQLLKEAALVHDCYWGKLHIKYNYSGCPNQQSRDKKDQAILKQLKEKVLSSEGKEKEKRLYQKAIERTNQLIAHLNGKYRSEIKRVFKNKPNYHKQIMSSYSDTTKKLVSLIDSKNKELKEIQQQIQQLSDQVAVEHRSIIKKEIQEYENVPEDVKEELNSIVDNLKIVGENIQLYSDDLVIIKGDS